MAYNKAKVIDEGTYNKMNKDTATCTNKIAECNQGDDNSFACQSAFMVCNMALMSPYRATGQNPYDYSKECGSEPLCYDFSRVETFMNSDATKGALHVKDHNPTWQTCNMEVNQVSVACLRKVPRHSPPVQLNMILLSPELPR